MKQHIIKWSMVQIRYQENHLKFLKLSENGNLTQQNLWDTLKAVFHTEGEWVALSGYIKKSERYPQTNDLMMQFKNLEKQEQTKCKFCR